MPSLNKTTGQQGASAIDPVLMLGGYEKIVKRKTSPQGDFQDQELYNIKEHFRIVSQGFKSLQTGRTH